MLTAEQQALAPTRGLGNVRRQYAVADIEVRAAEDNSGDVSFAGHASVTGRAYPMYGGPDKGGWDETIMTGAFKKTLSEKPDVAFLLNHGGMTLARTKSGTLELAEDTVGLAVKATMDPGISVVNDITLAMQRGDLDEMSFAFRVVKDAWLDAEGEEVAWWDLAGVTRNIKEVSLAHGDVSVVNFGANPFTDAALRAVEARAFLDSLREVRAGATLSTATVSTLTQVLASMGYANDNVGDATETLSALLGLPGETAGDGTDGETAHPGGPADPGANGQTNSVSASYYADLQQLHQRRELAA